MRREKQVYAARGTTCTARRPRQRPRGGRGLSGVNDRGWPAPRKASAGARPGARTHPAIAFASPPFTGAASPARTVSTRRKPRLRAAGFAAGSVPRLSPLPLLAFVKKRERDSLTATPRAETPLGEGFCTRDALPPPGSHQYESCAGLAQRTPKRLASLPLRHGQRALPRRPWVSSRSYKRCRAGTRKD